MGIEVVRDEVDKTQFDPTVVEGLDPNYHYRWARKEPKNLLMHGVHGYETVTAITEQSILGDRTRVKQGEQLSTGIEWGDMILIRTPKENHEKRLGAMRAKILRQTRGVTETYRNAIARITGSNAQSYEDHGDRDRSGETFTQDQFDHEMRKSPEEVEG